MSERLVEYMVNLNRKHDLLAKADAFSARGCIGFGALALIYFGWHVWRIL